MGSLRWSAYTLFLWFFTTFTYADEGDFPWLTSLETGDQVRESGARLMKLPTGLHALEDVDTSNTRIVIGVHGWQSEGYEWVYPLKTMDSDDTTTYFFRWDYTTCPIDSGRLLIGAIEASLDSHPNADSLLVIGHSLGGVLLASVAESFDFSVKSELHMVATPLQGLENERCAEQKLPKSSSSRRDIFQWRTQHELDNAFNRLSEDPQNVDLPDSVVIRLPAKYNERRLGHNWSISWVSEKLKDE